MKAEYDKLTKAELIKQLKLKDKKVLDCSKESERLKSLFLANISHEVRTPLNAILGFSGLLKEPNLSEEDKNSFIEGIAESSYKLLNTIDNIIQTAKIESKRISLKEEACNINQLMSELFNSYNKYKGNIGKGHIELRLRKEINGNPYMLTDISKLSQILANLIDNALKFTKEGYIEIGYEFLDKDTIHFFVKDTGVGIPTNKYNAIFEKFNQVETTYGKKHSGLGVGLTISNNFAQLLGGTMGLRSTVNNGSEFFINLPFIAAKNLKPQKQKDKKTTLPNNWLEHFLTKYKSSKTNVEIYPNWSKYSA